MAAGGRESEPEPRGAPGGGERGLFPDVNDVDHVPDDILLLTPAGLVAVGGDDPSSLPPTATTSVSHRTHQREKPRGGDHFLLKFSLSFALAAAAVMFSSTSFPQWSTTVLNARLEFRSMLLATLFLFVVLFLAYLSNPSETSFRSYLTEQSFRHHLSRLNDPSDDQDHSDSEDSGVHYRPSRLESDPDAFHFSSRASVALRTPRHAFHSFAFFTIAAVIPTPRAPPTSSRAPVSSSPDLTGSQTKEAWFIGAFGRWWRGALIDASWPPKAKSEEEGWSSGILNVKALDKLEHYNGLPFPTTTSTPQRSTPPKLRSRDRSAQRQSRTSSPPPLPKSATLPLHTPRHAQTLVVPSISPPSHPQPPPRTPSNSNLAHSVQPVPVSYDSTPAIAELLRQIDATRTLNDELRVSLSDHAAVTASTDEALAAELQDVRETKRTEDVARAELKARTKTLEEAKRVAEAGRREAERRLRLANASLEDAGARACALRAEIDELEASMQADGSKLGTVAEEALKEEQEVKQRLERRRREVRVAEEVVAALGVRVKELEEAVARERELLASVRARALSMRNEPGLISLGAVKTASATTPQDREPWDYLASVPSEQNCLAVVIPEPFPTPLEKESSSGSSRSAELASSPRSRPLNLNLQSISNLSNISAPAAPTPNGIHSNDVLARRARGYTIFDDDLASLSTAATSTAFSPFAEDAATDVNVGNGPRTGSSTAYIPSNLIQSLDSATSARTATSVESADALLSKSFQSDSDAFVEHDWRRRAPESTVVGSQPQSLHVSSPSTTPLLAPAVAQGRADVAYDPFEVRQLQAQQRLISDPMEAQRSAWLVRANSDPVHGSNESFNGTFHGNGTFYPANDTDPSLELAPARRHWWSSSSDSKGVAERERKGLNPDAKVFRFSRNPLSFLPTASAGSTPLDRPFDSLNPSANPLLQAPPRTASPGFFSSLAMRAFAPSPAEREALQRALGGSTNTSLERLPSLSEVGSIPASPTHTHAHAAPFELGHAGGARSWLHGLTAPRKIKFSPWADAEDE
ncbi:hypothetical protein FA95DRAFT_1422682 [Auriscalpium vulgare]|uniref:Uncharacterized protein n=1 Tax=Auriscalpium vulgare TaxID=40419 RepID=A0ACB8RR11_9AGAM|nr:hypothetical protein FA95DRAFT_1422682 [Auriscalpium vulgare]